MRLTPPDNAGSRKSRTGLKSTGKRQAGWHFERPDTTMTESTGDAAMPQAPTVQQLKKRAVELAGLSRNRGWLELSKVLAALHGHRDENAKNEKAKNEKGKAEFRWLIEDRILKPRRAYYLLKVGQLIYSGELSEAEA